MNPEPLALFADVIAAGEGESADSGPGRKRFSATRSRAELYTRLATHRGFYIPSVVRRPLRGGRHDCGVRAEAGIECPDDSEEGGGEE